MTSPLHFSSIWATRPKKSASVNYATLLALLLSMGEDIDQKPNPHLNSAPLHQYVALATTREGESLQGVERAEQAREIMHPNAKPISSNFPSSSLVRCSNIGIGQILDQAPKP